MMFLKRMINMMRIENASTKDVYSIGTSREPRIVEFDRHLIRRLKGRKILKQQFEFFKSLRMDFNIPSSVSARDYFSANENWYELHEYLDCWEPPGWLQKEMEGG